MMTSATAPRDDALNGEAPLALYMTCRSLARSTARIDPAVQSPDETAQEETTQKVRRSARRRLSVRLPSLHSTLSHAEDFTTAPGAAAPLSARRLGSPTVSSPGAHYMKMTEDGEWTFSYINPEEPNQYHREGQPDKQDGFLYQLIRFPMLVSEALY